MKIKIYLTIILKAPSGVTSTADAYMYATKFAISPTITEIIFQNKIKMDNVEIMK